MTVNNALDTAFRDAKAAGRAALIPYLTAGFPSPNEYVEIAVAILEAGADVLEIGVPFSDPLLDGPAIQHSQQVALEAGVTPADCFDFAHQIRARVDKPLLFMGAYNPIAAIGVESYCRYAAEVGVSALIVPDLPVEEQDDLHGAAVEHDLHLIQMVAPTSTPERTAHVCSQASGFIYCVSVAGVTGARSGIADLARPLVERVRGCTDLPVAVGFGIAGPAEAQAVGAFADGVIVGSALVNRVAEATAGQANEAARAFVSELAAAIRSESTASV
jgi:tryptophan synthase alpha chain